MDVSLLIQDAYVYANILAEIGESANATQVNVGLKLLNSLIRTINLNGRYLALTSEDLYTLTPNVETFSIPGYIQLLKIQFLLGNGLWMNIMDVGINQYLNDSRIVHTSGIPYETFCKRTPTGIDLLLFFKPSQNYTLRVFGVKNLDQLAVTDQIEGITEFHQDLLMFRLAKELQVYYQMQPTPYITARIIEIQDAIQDTKDYNYDIRLSSIGRRSSMTDVADLNILQGYVPD